MGMTCEGCAGAARRVLGKIGVEDVVIDVDAKTVVVTSDKGLDELLETLKKTGKTVDHIETKKQ